MPARRDDIWTEDDWRNLEIATTRAVIAAPSADQELLAVARRARNVLQTFSTSFFIVTRFLPQRKRQDVELIYAAVRYPDEIVDTFPLGSGVKRHMLERWRSHYLKALGAGSIRDAINHGAPSFVAAFAQLVVRHGIPSDYYEAFLDAMTMDVTPRPYSTLDDLIDSYVYGSAIVVGYFLAYVYGPGVEGDFSRALEASRDLGIALQLTNFLRDVKEDQRRGRVYLPADMLAAEGIGRPNLADPRDLNGLNKVVRRVAEIAEGHYTLAANNVDAFAADSRVAIQACIDVYRQLNGRIGRSPEGVLHRETVPMREKLRVLPSSKYWRLPMAFAGRI